MLTDIRKYFDEPRALLRDWRRAQTNAMRSALADRLPEGVKIEEVLHDDASFDEGRPVGRAGQVRRLFNSRLALHAAAHVEHRVVGRQFMLALAALIVVVVATTYLTIDAIAATESGALFSRLTTFSAGLGMFTLGVYLAWISLGLSPAGYRLLAPSTAALLGAAEIDDAGDFAQRVLVRTSPTDTPADLADVFRPLNVDASGQPVDGQIVSSDYTDSSLRDALPSPMPVIALAGAGLIASGLGAMVTQFLAFLAIPLLLAAVFYAGLKLFLLPDLSARRGVEAQEALRRSPTAKLVDQVSPVIFQQLEAAKKAQVADAIADKTPIIQLGTTTGLLAGRRDPLAPSHEVMPFGLSVSDLSTHILVIGATGSGKTACVLRPLVAAWAKAQAGGLLVLDGKGALPAELAGLEGFEVITPDQPVAFAPMENLTPDQVADALFESFAGKDGSKDPFWEKAAAELIRSAAKTLALLVDLEVDGWIWSLGSLHRLIFSADGVEAALTAIEGTKEQREAAAKDKTVKLIDKLPGHIRRGYDDFTRIFPAMPDDTRNSIKQHASVWLGLMVNNALLGDWADADTGVQVEDALRGKRLGLLLPEFVYGKAGAVIANFAKQRFYAEVKKRGEKWKTGEDGHARCLLLVDECQALIGESEKEVLPILRSLGGCAAFATQSLDGLQVALQNQPAQLEQILGQFRSVIGLAVNTNASCEFLASRLGAIPRAIFAEVPAPASDAAGTVAALQLNAGSYGRGTLMASAAGAVELRGLRGNGLAGEAWTMVGQLAEKVGLRQAYALLPSALNEKEKAGSAKIDTHALVTAAEVRSLTAEKFTALAVVNRAGVDRRDLIKLTPKFDFAKKESV